MNRRPRHHEIDPDDPGYVQMWARDILAAVGKRQARVILDDYRALAGNKRLAKRDREKAAERAKALRKVL